MIITISTPDEFYFNQLLAFLASVKTNSPSHKVNIFLANYPKDIENKLIKTFPEYSFNNKKINKKDKRGIGFILYRIELILDCFEKYNSSVSWIDTDVLVRKDLSSFIDIKPKQIKILYRGDKKFKKVRFNAGIFSIGHSVETNKMINRWEKLLLTKMKWGQGQLALFNAYTQHSHRVRLIKMDKKFNDLGSLKGECFLDDSVMWHCKKLHFKNKKFQKEFKKYLKIGKEIYGE